MPVQFSKIILKHGNKSELDPSNLSVAEPVFLVDSGDIVIKKSDGTCSKFSENVIELSTISSAGQLNSCTDTNKTYVFTAIPPLSNDLDVTPTSQFELHNYENYQTLRAIGFPNKADGNKVFIRIHNSSTNTWDKFIDITIPDNSVVTDSISLGAVTKSKLSSDVQNDIARFSKKSDKSLIKLKDVDKVVNEIRLSVKNNHIHICGTATSQITTGIEIEEGITTFEQGADYTASLQNIVNRIYHAMGIYLWGTYSSDYGYIQPTNGSKYVSVKIDTTSERNISLRFNISAGTYDREFDFMVESGTEMTEFEPYYTIDYPNTSVDFAKLSAATQNIIKSKYDASNIEAGTAPITITGYTKDDFYALNCRYQTVGDYCYITFTANPKVAIDSPLVFSGLPFVAYNTSILAAYTGKNSPIKIEITNDTSNLTITKMNGEAFLAGETNTFTIGHRIKS